MSVGSRIKEARLRQGMTQEQLAAALGVSKGAVGNYESEVTYPKTEVLYKIFKVLKCDANYIYQDDMRAMGAFHVTFPEQELLKRYRALDDFGQQAIRAVLDIEYARATARNTSVEIASEISPKIIPMRVYCDPAAAGAPLYAESEYEMIDFPENEIPSGTTYGIRIAGDSMDPSIPDGCIVWVEKTENVHNQDIVIAWVDGEGTVCKRALINGTDRVTCLKSDNRLRGDIEGHELNDLKIYGRVVGHTNHNG